MNTTKLMGVLFSLYFIGTTNSIMAQTKKKAITTTKTSSTPVLSVSEIGNGLKEALDKGITKQVSKLTTEDGFYKNEAVKILLPEELQVVDKKLRQLGMTKLADQGILVLNRAAEDAVKQATPVFVDAVKKMTFADAKTILLGNENAATTYLQASTTASLTEKFTPVIKTSFSNVGADVIWEQIISKYNSIPFITKINPDLVGHTTNKALDGVFKMIAVEEKDIRKNVSFRNTDLLKKVFSLQDKLHTKL
jgi:hypothetical protein